MIAEGQDEQRYLNISTFLVQEFVQVFGQPMALSPEIIPPDRAELRQNLLEEEVGELRDAMERKNLPDILDAICDIQYILSGTILEYGLHNIFDSVFLEVHESNIRKLFESGEEVQKAVDYYDSKGIETTIQVIEMNDGTERFVLKRAEDGKILKPFNWQAPDIEGMLEEFKAIEDAQERIEAQA